ncbi:porphobilinogen synthase [Parvularcula sp. ZS-1/3]|uniref:Delta-aminolevulinic acid dehydratase n=1 Tax=Parvularcula mediterranea TaxID=2732508 RepID=A0A7Y3W6B8_9PROT|nr:porphobilinogen synthase [Parvularcula mediterranea]NNU17182.1 porphobilinogen synthase [Parvularcula mediterranea]
MKNIAPSFPRTRMRRLRRSEGLRALVMETRLTPSDLIQGVILREDDDPADIPAMGGLRRLTIGESVELAQRCVNINLAGLALFPFTKSGDRDEGGTLAFDEDNLMCRAARAIKAAVPEAVLIADVALDPYTDHGHDGLMGEDGTILNDPTVDALIRQANVLAGAGFDVVAPSDMMDGRIGAIRDGLDAEGFEDVAILSYAVKYASAFYGPYRDAVGSRGALKGDKRTYQMNPANGDEGLREAALDVSEGADMLMIKPGLPYLDMVRRVKDAFGMPTVAFHVSGEYAMLNAAAEAGAMDFDAGLMESLLCFKRAGADAVITYGAEHAAKLLDG